MPVYDYTCECGYHDNKFVWHLEDEVVCPLCHKPMRRLFTGTFAELKSKRSKPYSYSWEPEEWNATKDNFESAKRDLKRGKTNQAEVDYWKKEVEKENPNLII